MLYLRRTEKRITLPTGFIRPRAAQAKFSTPIVVLDTDSALGRYSFKTKEIGVKDLSRFHGHMCDGLVIAYIEIKEVFKKLFPKESLTAPICGRCPKTALAGWIPWPI